MRTEEEHLIPELAFSVEKPNRRCGCCCWCLTIMSFILLIVAGLGVLVWYYTWQWGCWNRPHLNFQDWYSSCFTLSVEGAQSGLAMAWQVDPKAPLLVSPGQQLFEYKSSDVNTVPMPDASTEITRSESSSEYARTISASVGISGSYYGFEAAAKVSAELILKTKKKVFRQDTFAKATELRMSRSVLQPHKYLTASARAFLLEEPPSKIVEKLGKFYADSVTMGGVYQFTIMTEMKETDNAQKVAASISAKYSKLMVEAAATVDAGFSREVKDTNREFRLKINVRGGDPKIWLGLQSDNFEQIQQKWVESMKTVDDMYPVSVRLRPLWELLDHADMNPNKAEKLKKYIMSS